MNLRVSASSRRLREHSLGETDGSGSCATKASPTRKCIARPPIHTSADMSRGRPPKISVYVAIRAPFLCQGPDAGSRAPHGRGRVATRRASRPRKRCEGGCAAEESGGARIAAPRGGLRDRQRGGIGLGERHELGGGSVRAAIGEPSSGLVRADDSGKVGVDRGRPRQRSPRYPLVQAVGGALRLRFALRKRAHLVPDGAKVRLASRDRRAWCSH